MSKTDGIGVISLSLEYLHVRRWLGDHRARAKSPTAFVAVNFDDPAPVEASITEFPGGETAKRDFVGRAELWHGLRLASMQDILHVEVRETPEGTAFASFSGPAASFLEEAFLESDKNGVRKEFTLDSASDFEGSTREGDFTARGVALARFRVKFHLQADILRALCDGVGVDVASVDTINNYAPQAAALCGAAETLTTARLRSLGYAFENESANANSKNAFDSKAAAQEREESRAFRETRRVDSATHAGSRSYAALTAGVRRFLSSQRVKNPLDEGRGSNLVRLLSDAREAEAKT
jgi:hypothetical protein